jgi:dTMP kinase
MVFEGIDGSGKTTQSIKLKEYLMKKNFEAVWFREPSDSKWGQEIRKLARKNDSVSQKKELDLFLKDRKWNVNHNLKPALKKNKIVILDRYFYSTICYQGARGFNPEEIFSANIKFAPLPDLIFLIDIEVDIALKRIKKNRSEISELFEREEFLREVRRLYLNLNFPNLKKINGNQTIDEIFKEILLHLNIS